jgi:hypothetical protein
MLQALAGRSILDPVRLQLVQLLDTFDYYNQGAERGRYHLAKPDIQGQGNQKRNRGSGDDGHNLQNIERYFLLCAFAVVPINLILEPFKRWIIDGRRCGHATLSSAVIW